MSAQLQPRWALRRMRHDDLEEIFAMEQRSYPFPWSEGVFLDCLKMGYSNWVLEGPDLEICAYSLLAFTVDEGHILNLTVDPDTRRQGVGQYLLESICGVAQRASLQRLILEVRPSNTAGLALYRKAGFEQIGRRRAYYPAANGREDAMVLARSMERKD